MSLQDDGAVRIAWRKARVAAHQLLRLADHARKPDDYPAAQRPQPGQQFGHLHGQWRFQIDRDDAAADPRLEAGKRHNLQLAAPFFDGVLLLPGVPLSFWRTLGRVTVARGFRHGLELRGGCLMPALGGGLCLLSNALFAVGAELGWTIVERHGHTLQAVPPPSDRPWGLDATLFWPYVDLRMAALQPVQLGCTIANGALTLTVHGDRPPQVRATIAARADRRFAVGDAHFRENQLVRDLFDAASGQLLGSAVIAHNRKQLLAPVQQARTCLTCGELACKSRQTIEV